MKTKTRRDYKTTIDNEVLNKMLELATKNDLEYEIFEGTTQDNYIIYNDHKIRLKGIKPRKYIIVQSVYLNCWSSKLEMIMTDNEEKVNEFIEQYSYEESDCHLCSES